MPRLSNLTATIEQHPGATFALFALVHLAVWTALPALLYPNLPLDLIEALTYGREWQLGYDKLPPLPWWLVEATHRLFGRDVFYYALAQVAVVAAFAALWAIARPMVGAVSALVALLIVDGQHYLHFTAAKFNHDVIQLPFWALAGYAFHAALRRGRMLHWVLLGVALGLALWAKYFVVVLVAPLALFLIFDREARKSLATPGPYVAAVVALVVAAPHLVWLVANDFLPFAYADARAKPSRGLIDHVFHPLQFLASQLLFIAPALFIAAPLVWRRPAAAAERAGDDYDRRIVALLAFGPAATTFVLSLVTGRGVIAMWGYPLWLFLGLWIVMMAPGLTRERFAPIAAIWAMMFVGFAAAFAASYAVMPRYDGRYRAVFYPGEALGAELSKRFRMATGRPLAYVVGDMWTGGNVAHYAPEHPRNLIDGSSRRAPWIDMSDLRTRGAVVVWTSGDPTTIPPDLRAVAGEAEVQPPFALPFRWGGRTLIVGWAILSPRTSFALAHVPEKACPGLGWSPVFRKGHARMQKELNSAL
jgi:4-amino-4-deoxy-L-arabinose transferase-like glycosyltransferase